jgi:hypothetical protein
MRRPAFNTQGLLSRVDLNTLIDEVSDRFGSLDRAIAALGVTDATNLASLTRTITNATGGGTVAAPARRVVYLACVANQATYTLGFTADLTQAVMAYIHGLALTPTVDYTMTPGAITLLANYVPTIAEGYILVEATPE